MLPKLSEIDGSNVRCANCDGEGWVCEDHPEVPWMDGEGCCGGAGMPCSCNPIHEAISE